MSTPDVRHAPGLIPPQGSSHPTGPSGPIGPSRSRVHLAPEAPLRIWRYPARPGSGPTGPACSRACSVICPRQLDNPPGPVGRGVPYGEQPDQPLTAGIEAGDGPARGDPLLPAPDHPVQLGADAIQPQRRLGHGPLIQRVPRLVPAAHRPAATVPPWLRLPHGLPERPPAGGIPGHARQRQRPAEHPGDQRVPRRPWRHGGHGPGLPGRRVKAYPRAAARPGCPQ